MNMPGIFDSSLIIAGFFTCLMSGDNLLLPVVGLLLIAIGGRAFIFKSQGIK